MLHEVFYWIFNMSITATVSGIVVLLLKSIKRIPRRIALYFWLVPFIRLVLPVGMNSPYSFMTLLSEFSIKTVTVYLHDDKFEFSMTNSIGAAESYFPVTYKINVVENIFHIASVFWLIVLVIAIAAFLIIYITSVNEVKKTTHIKGNIYVSERIKTPAVYGILKPKIILPVSYNESYSGLIIMHEEMHIRRKDNLWRILAFMIALVYWFNPFVWLFLKEFLSDVELSCDEKLVTIIGEERKKEYAQLLLRERENTNLLSSAFGGAKIRTRIENILSYKKITIVSSIVFMLLFTVISLVLLTNAD